MAHHSSLPFGGLVLRRGNGGLTTRVGFLGAIVLLFVAEFLPAAVSGSDGIQFFENQIRPIFVEHCYSCHSASAAKVKGGLKLDTREDFLRGGTDGPVVAPGDPAKSPLVLRVRGVDKEHRMPPAKEGVDPLPRMAIDHLVRWVEMGAPYPATPASLLARETSRRPWSWDPPRANPAPTLQHPEWARTSIDPFLLSPLEKVGLQPVAPATRLTWIRRVTFDLTGLPPTPEEIKAFELDSTNDAYERVVDRLLASPRYGEQWGRHWLDVVRYADTAGDTADYPVGLAWKYRNYVIQSFNQDKPYPEFLQEQIAGDILAEAGPRERYADRVAATGFLAISRRFGFDSEHYQHLTIQDTIDTLGQTVLGLSLGCARCHDHKFDPVSMRDYYALYGIFASTRYSFPGSEQKAKLRAMVPLIPPTESQPRLRDYDREVAQLTELISQRKQSPPSAVFRSLHDPDGDFETQKDAAGGSYGVIVPPWLCSGKISVTLAAQSPYRNLYPSGRFGASIPSGDHDYWLSQELLPAKALVGARHLYLNLDFRLSGAGPATNGIHRFWLGNASTGPAIEMLLSAEGLRTRRGDQWVTLAQIQPHEWHNLQLLLNPTENSFTGTLTAGEKVQTFPAQPYRHPAQSSLDHVQCDSNARKGMPLPMLELDNFALQSEPIPPASKSLPRVLGKGTEAESEFASVEAELRSLLGWDGDLEGQSLDSPPAHPWNPGPNSSVVISSRSQSPFRNHYPSGKLGIHLPQRTGYDGLGLTFPSPWKSSTTEQIYAAFDFRCAADAKVAPGTWRYYLGHGAGNGPAVILFFHGEQLFARSGDSVQNVAHLTAGQWHQVQIQVNLKTKKYQATVAGESGEQRFEGSVATGWDGTLDYTFIDSYGNLPGVRPGLDADNFVVRETPLQPIHSVLAPPDLAEIAKRGDRAAQLRSRLAALGEETTRAKARLTQLLLEGPSDMAYGVVEGTPHDEPIQLRGEPDRPGKEVRRGMIAALGGTPLPPDTRGSGRLELARWLTEQNQALTARVMVNRIWLYHFGRGLVATPNDFGVRGQLPTHPELLDHLARRFIQSGWSVKAVHREIVLSTAYRTASELEKGSITSSPATDYRAFHRRRLSAEEIRDSILMLSGDLDLSPAEGHPFPSPVTASYSQHGPFSGVYDHSHRSVYLMTQRLKRHPFLGLFDGADPNASTAERRITTVPTQALFFLNSPFVHEKALHLAKRIRASTSKSADSIELAWQRIVGRAPTSAESSDAQEFLADYRNELGKGACADPELEALSAYIRSLFGSNEFIHLD